MEIETTVNETIPNSEGENELNETEEMASPEKANAETASAEETKPAESEEKPRVPKIPIEAPKNNGVTTTTPAKAKPLAGVVVQFPEMFSLKRDAHFLEKFQDASDIKMQRTAYIECDSEETATALQKKLNGSNLNERKVTGSRLDLTEKNVLYINGIKRETTDDMVKAAFEGLVQMRRESYNSYLLFSSETAARTAKAKINKDGVCGIRVNVCEFDNRGKDRFKTEEPAAKKQKVEEPKAEEKPAAEEAEAKPEEEEAEKPEEEEQTEEAEEHAEEAEEEKEEEECMEEGGEEEAVEAEDQ